MLKQKLLQIFDNVYRRTWELCSNCNSEVKIPNDRASKCPECNEEILPCSMCNMDVVKCSKCPYEKNNLKFETSGGIL